MSDAIETAQDIVSEELPASRDNRGYRVRRDSSCSSRVDGDAAGLAHGETEAVKRRVTGGRWGASSRFQRRASTSTSDVGPGQYNPTKSAVAKKVAGVKIAPPTKKTLALHMKKFEEIMDKEARGPGDYSPNFHSTSESKRASSAIIPKQSQMTLNLLRKKWEDMEESSSQVPFPTSLCARIQSSHAPAPPCPAPTQRVVPPGSGSIRRGQI